MDFTKTRNILLVCSTALLNSCGGSGDEDDPGSGGSSSANNAYRGETAQATLSLANRDLFLRITLGDQAIRSLAEAFLFESDIDDLRSRIATSGSTDYQETIACFPGTEQVVATTNATTTFFNINVEFSDCSGNSVSLDGSLRGTFSYSDSYLTGGDKTREELNYRSLIVENGNGQFLLRGEEELTYNLSRDSSELEKEITLTDRDADRQRFYEDLDLSLNNDQEWHLDGLESLSGRVYDSVEGYVALSLSDSNRYDGELITLNGASGTRITVDYEDGSNEVIIEYYEGGSTDPVTTETLTNTAFSQLLNP